MPHTVGSDNSDVVVMPRLLNSHTPNFFCDVVGELISNLEAKNQIGGEGFTESKQQPSEPTANIDNFNLFIVSGVCFIVVGGVFYGIADCCMVLLLGASEEHGVMGFPVDVIWVDRVGEWSGVEWINMCSHTVFPSLWKQPRLLFIRLVPLRIGITLVSLHVLSKY